MHKLLLVKYNNIIALNALSCHFVMLIAKQSKHTSQITKAVAAYPLKLPLQIYLAVNTRTALAINVAAQSETHIQMLRCFKGESCRNAQAVTAVVSRLVGNSYARQIGELVAGATLVA